MTREFAILAAALSLSACSAEPVEAPSQDVSPSPVESPENTGAPPSMPRTDAGTAVPSGSWEMVSSGEGDGLFFGVTEGEPARVHLFCPSGGGLLGNVGAFRPIGSEERMTFGSGATVVTLVADPSGDTLRGGVSGEGPVPSELAAILTGVTGLSVNYGSQNVGPLPPVSTEMTRDFVAGCSD